MSRDYKCEIEITGLEKYEADNIRDRIDGTTQLKYDDIRCERDHLTDRYCLRASSAVTLSGGISEKEFSDFMIRQALYRANESHPVQVRLTCLEDLPCSLFSSSLADFRAAKEHKAEDDADEDAEDEE